jgi:hypothetical protein
MMRNLTLKKKLLKELKERGFGRLQYRSEKLDRYIKVSTYHRFTSSRQRITKVKIESIYVQVSGSLNKERFRLDTEYDLNNVLEYVDIIKNYDETVLGMEGFK